MDQNIVWLALAGLLLAVPVWRVSRSQQKFGYDREQFLLAGRRLDPLRHGLAAASLIWLGPLLLPHLALLQRSGLSYGTLALAVVPLYAIAALLTFRLARLARLCHLLTPAELIGSFYQSPLARRLAALTAVLVALCLAVLGLRLGGDIAEGLVRAAPRNTGLSLPRLAAMAALTLPLLLPAALGGMGAVLRIAAGAAVLTALGLVAALLLAIATAGGIDGLSHGLHRLMTQAAAAPLFAPGRLFDAEPAAAPANLAWPGTMVLSTLLAALGLAVAPAALSAGFSASRPDARSTRPLVFALAAGLALVAMAPPLGLLPQLLGLGGGLAGTQPLTAPGSELAFLAAVLTRSASGSTALAAGALALLLSAAIAAAAAALFAAAAALAHDFGSRRAARSLRAPLRQRVRVNSIALAAGACLLALAGPADAAPLALLAGAYALQLLPALVGIGTAPGPTPLAVERGLIAGLVAVTLTAEPAVALAARLGLPLPFAAWPLGLHPAAWGLAANLSLLAIYSRPGRPADGGESEAREFRRAYRQLAGRPPGDSGRAQRLAFALAALFLALLLAPLAGLVDTAPAGAPLPPLWLWQVAAFLVGLPLVHLIARRLQPGGTDGTAPPARPRLRLKARVRPQPAPSPDRKDTAS